MVGKIKLQQLRKWIKHLFKTQLILLMVLSTTTAVSSKVTYKEIDVQNGGSVSGKVVFQGERPTPKKKTINKDVDTCGEGQREYDIAVISDDGTVKDAVVYIENITEGKAWEGGETYELEQEKCTFMPKSYVVKKGAQLKVWNKDNISHNIHTYEMVGRARITMFNSSQPADSRFTKPIRLRRPKSHAIKLECDHHNFMHEWMFAADNPYFSVTDSLGAFEITGVPPGKYKLAAWHPVLGTITALIEVKAGERITQSFLLKK